MKKVIIIIVILLILAGGGGAAYYFLVLNKPAAIDPSMMNTNNVAEMDESLMQEVEEVALEMRYIVSEKADVYNGATFESDVIDILDLRDEISIYDTSGRWVRINKQSEKEGQWIYSQDTSSNFPSVTEKEKRLQMKRLIRGTDDFEQNEERFIDLTMQVIATEDCSQEDIQILGGWIRSLTYSEEPVYYTYCGGIEPQNKLYLNLASGEWFRADQ
jgi:hypothetical protein